MDLVHLLKVYIAVAELESFSDTAVRMDISPAAVSRAIRALEQRLGAPLVQRSTRNVGLTEAGIRYLDHARQIIETIKQADEALAREQATPSGTLRVTAPRLFGKSFVMPTITRYLLQHPQVDVAASFNDRVVDSIKENVDVAVRIGHLPDSGLRAIPVGTVKRVLCAAPCYLEEHGTPEVPEDLQHHALIAASSLVPRMEWTFARDDRSTALRIRPRLTVSSNDVAIEAAIAGLGIARVHAYQIRSALKDKALVLVLEQYEQGQYPINILHRETHYSTPKVRTFLDALTHDLRRLDLS